MYKIWFQFSPSLFIHHVLQSKLLPAGNSGKEKIFKCCAWFGIYLCKDTTHFKNRGFDHPDKCKCVSTGSGQMLQAVLMEQERSKGALELAAPHPSCSSQLFEAVQGHFACVLSFITLIHLNFCSLGHLASGDNVVSSCVAHTLVDFLQNLFHILTWCSSPAFSSRGLAEEPPWSGGALPPTSTRSWLDESMPAW